MHRLTAYLLTDYVLTYLLPTYSPPSTVANARVDTRLYTAADGAGRGCVPLAIPILATTKAAVKGCSGLTSVARSTNLTAPHPHPRPPPPPPSPAVSASGESKPSTSSRFVHISEEEDSVLVVRLVVANALLRIEGGFSLQLAEHSEGMQHVSLSVLLQLPNFPCALLLCTIAAARQLSNFPCALPCANAAAKLLTLLFCDGLNLERPSGKVGRQS